MTTPHRPKPFCTFTTPAMWNDPHISAHMLVNHLDPDSSLTSRSHSFINHSAEWIISLLRLCSGDHVLDLGCGPGLYACRLARKGISMTGIDVSARSLDHARAVAVREGLPATFAQGSYLDFDLDQDFDAAILIYEDYCALSPGQRANLLGRITAPLKNGGHFLFDVTASPRFSDFSDAIVETKNLMGASGVPRPTTDAWKLGLIQTFASFWKNTPSSQGQTPASTTTGPSASLRSK